jgi:hypothetical protein
MRDPDTGCWPIQFINDEIILSGGIKNFPSEAVIFTDCCHVGKGFDIVVFLRPLKKQRSVKYVVGVGGR